MQHCAGWASSPAIRSFDSFPEHDCSVEKFPEGDRQAGEQTEGHFHTSPAWLSAILMSSFINIHPLLSPHLSSSLERLAVLLRQTSKLIHLWLFFALGCFDFEFLSFSFSFHHSVSSPYIPSMAVSLFLQHTWLFKKEAFLLNRDIWRHIHTTSLNRTPYAG